MKPQRIQLSRKKGWHMPPNTVRVTRPGPFGNPFKIGQDYGEGPLAAALAVELFRVHPICEAIRQRAKKELRGKNLGCFCKSGEPCHADVLLEIANQP